MRGILAIDAGRPIDWSDISDAHAPHRSGPPGHFDRQLEPIACAGCAVLHRADAYMHRRLPQ